MFTKLIVHILLNNINKCMHIFDIPIVINCNKLALVIHCNQRGRKTLLLYRRVKYNMYYT